MEPPNEPDPAQPPAIRVGDRDRDAAAHRLQDAFAEGRLDDDEFDQRMRAALTAKVSTELDVLTADLPAAAPRPAAIARTADGPRPGKLAMAYKVPSAAAAGGACRSGSAASSTRAAGGSTCGRPNWPDRRPRWP